MASFPENSEGIVTINTAHNTKTDTISVEVMDNGVGVSEDIRGRLFEPYATTKREGTGLGLSIVNQIISDHQGFIRYSDRKPSGSIFSIEFRGA